MRVERVLAAYAAASLLGGCATNLKVDNFDKGADRPGLGYVLPFNQYQVKMQWRVAECGAQLKIAPTVEIANGYADDARHAYLIDPSSLETLLSISNFQAKWHDGSNLISMINVANEDRTGPVIGKIVTGVGKLALAAAGAGSADPGGTEACLEGTVKALATVKQTKTELDGLNKRVADAQTALKAATAKVTILGGNATAADKQALSDALDALTRLLEEQTTKTETLASALKKITYTQSVRWPGESSVFSTQTAYALPARKLEDWASLRRGEDERVIAATSIHLAIESTSRFGRSGAVVAGEQDSGGPGIRYRMPAQGRMRACSVACAKVTSEEEVLAQHEGPIAQLGWVNVLPVRARRFGATSFAAEFNTLGGLKSAGYEQKAAPVEGVATAFGEAAAAVSPLVAYEQGRTARERTEELARLDFLKKQRDALAALEVTTPSDAQLELEALQADTTLQNARLSNLQAQIALEELLRTRTQP